MSISSGRSSGFNDDKDWASTAVPPQSAATGNIPPSAGFSEDFLEDFDDDDDAFFATAGGDATDPSLVDSRADGANKSTSQLSASSFGMVSLTYKDAAPSLTSMRGGRFRPTSPTFGQADTTGDSLAGDDISDDAELSDIDQRYLIHLRNPNSQHRVVARCCLVLHQLVYATDHSGKHQSNNSSVATSSSQLPIQIESSSIYHIQRYQRLIHRILSSLKKCLTSHNSPSCRSLASTTLASTARASYARLRFDARLMSVRLPPSIATRLEDECGNGAAYSLVVAAIEQGNDGVSSAALEALGRLTLEPNTDNLAAEVRGIAECASSNNTFMYENDSKSCWILEHSHAMKELQSKAWEHVMFPRMQHILHRISLYTSPRHLAKAIPAVSAAFVHALTQGHDTKPSRRAMQTGKASHGKRGWREVDAEGLAKGYVEGILLPCLSGHGKFHSNQCDKVLQRTISIACIRMSSASPYAQWRVPACRHAAIALMRQLKEMASAPVSVISFKSPTKLDIEGKSSPISTSIAPASVPVETLAGTAAMLVIALRGMPLHERAPGLTELLRATLLFLPLGIPLSSGAGSFDLPIGNAHSDLETSHYRLGRIGLLTEAALCVMLDGATNANHFKVNEPSNEKNVRESITGARSVLMHRILQSDQLTAVWDGSKNKKDSHFYPSDELLWVFCSVMTQVGNTREKMFAKDATSAMEWSNVALVMLEFFAGIICNPIRQSRSPFADASHAAYNGLFAAVLKRCGSFPPSTLSISRNMLPSSFDAPSDEKTSPVVGGPGKQLHHVASALSQIATKILFLRDKSKHATAQIGGASVESSSSFIQLSALLVDAWLGRCIMNHDTKQSNQAQLDMGLMFLPLCYSEVEMLLLKYRAIDQKDKFVVVSQLCNVLITSLEHIACMSELITHAASRELREGVSTSEKHVGSLAINMLNGIITFAKEGVSANTEEDSMLRYQIALDANNAISRITDCIHTRPQSDPEDIVSAFKVSPLMANVYPKSSLSSPGQREPKDHCAWFLYHHARLVLSHRTDLAAKAVAPTSYSLGAVSSSKLIHRDALRMTSPFSHSTIEMFQKLRDLPLLIPTQPSRDGNSEAVTLTGCSDPVSLILSHGIRRTRNSCSTEDASLVVTMKLYNITPVPIRNGVRLDLKIAQEIPPNGTEYLDDGSDCVATSMYRNEIKGGDFVTWEVTVGNWRVGNLSLQASVTFRELEQEPSTHKWVSGGRLVDGHALPNEAMDDEEESMLDITLPCMPISLSLISSLQPCPLVFFGGLRRCESNLGRGDTASFDFLWNYMEGCERLLPFVTPNAQMEGDARTLADTTKGYIILSSSTLGKDGSGDPMSSMTGCAFAAPGGGRIFCTHQVKSGGAHVLHVRSDSSYLLESLFGTSMLQASFLRFVFGADALLGDESVSQVHLGKRPDLGHDFPSLTMRSNVGHDFPSMTMPTRKPVLG